MRKSIRCPSCGNPDAGLAIGIERWWAENGRVVPCVFIFCQNEEQTCLGLPLREVIWMPLREMLNFAEALRASRLVLTKQAEQELGQAIEFYMEAHSCG